MGSEKGGAKVIGGGGIFNLFDWKRKSRKKLFSNSPEGSKLVKMSEETLLSGRLHLGDDDEGIGVSSFKGSSDYSCASSVTDEEVREMKAPGVVARLMGLDAMPTSGVPEPYCTPFRDTRLFRYSHSLKRSHEYSMNDQFSHVPQRVDGYIRKPLDLRAPKMPSSPIERFRWKHCHQGLQSTYPCLTKVCKAPVAGFTKDSLSFWRCLLFSAGGLLLSLGSGAFSCLPFVFFLLLDWLLFSLVNSRHWRMIVSTVK